MSDSNLLNPNEKPERPLSGFGSSFGVSVATRERGRFIGARPGSRVMEGNASSTTPTVSTTPSTTSPPSTPTNDPSPIASSPVSNSLKNSGSGSAIQLSSEKKPEHITLKVRCVANKSFRQMKVDISNTAGALIQQLTKKFNFAADELAIFIPPPASAAPEERGIWIPREQKLGSTGLKEGDVVDLKRTPSAVRIAYVDPTNVFSTLHVDLSEPFFYSIPSLVALLHPTDFKREEFVVQLKGNNELLPININKPLQEQNVKAQSILVLIPISSIAKKPMVSTPTQQGWLTKRSIVDGRMTPTKRRYCIVKDNFLWYYKSIQQPYANGVIALEYYFLVGDRSADKLELKLTPSGICFYNPLQVYFLNASSSTEYDEWAGMLKERCATDADTYGLYSKDKGQSQTEKTTKMKTIRDTVSTKDLRIMERYSSVFGFGKLINDSGPLPQTNKREPIQQSLSPEQQAELLKAKDKLQENLMNFCKDESPEERRKRMRSEIISELLYSEKTYLKNMSAAQKYIMEPLSLKTIVTKQEVRDLFSNLEEIIPCSQKLLRYLQGVEELPPEEQAIGTVFLQMATDLKVYHQYCVEQDKSMAVREKLYQRPVFNEFLEETYKQPESGTSLDNILIQPMQRITRYPLLLRELLKYTPEDHEDHERVKEAMDVVSNIVNEIEKTRDQAESINKMREIRNKFVDNLPALATAGSFTKEGQVKKIKPGGGTTPAVLFLFSNILLIGLPQQNSNKLTLDCVLELHTCLVESVKDAKYKNVVMINSTDDNSLFRFSCSSEQEKETWISALMERIANIAPIALSSGVESTKVAKLISFDPDLYPITALVHDLEAQIFRLKEENQELKRKLGLVEGTKSTTE